MQYYSAGSNITRQRFFPLYSVDNGGYRGKNPLFGGGETFPLFFSGKSLTKGNYEFMRIVYIVLFIADIIILILNTEVNDHNFGQSLAFIMLLVYVSLDIVMFMFATEIIGIFDKMRKDKSNL